MISSSVIGRSIGPSHSCLSDPLLHSMNTKLLIIRVRELENLATYRFPTAGALKCECPVHWVHRRHVEAYPPKTRVHRRAQSCTIAHYRNS